MQTKQYDIILVGAGLVGSALALSLARQSTHRIALIERAPQLIENHNPNQRVVALGSTATTMLDELGVLEELGSSFCHPYQQMFIWDENSAGELSFKASDHGVAMLGHMIDSVQCNLVLQRMIEECSSIDSYYESVCEKIEYQDDCAVLHTLATTFSSPLIIAADGGSSWIRQQVKIFANKLSYSQQGIVAKISTQKSHQDIAWQRFMSSGPLAVLPIKDNQSSIVWSADQDTASRLMSLSNSEFEQALANALEQKLGEVSLLSQRVAFPLVSQKADKYFSRNVVLVGDAAHSIHPLAGQGANLGFKDVHALVELLSQTPKQSLADMKLLQRYQRSRKADNEQTDLMMSALHHAYQDGLPAWLALRGVGMNMLNRSNALKKLLVRQAMGL